MRKYFCLLVILSLPGVATAQNRVFCEALENYSVPGSDVEISEATWFADRSMENRFGPAMELPPHCHVLGNLHKRTGVNGAEYALRFAINLPDDWNGRYLFQGGGGLNGVLNEPVGAQATGNRSALDRGFAVVSTDSGHQASGGFDASFMEDQEAALNFLFLGNARVTDATKPIVSAYYGQDIAKAYFVGCSTGGREGMIMAQRFPRKFDGIVSGAPAIRTGLSNLALRWISVHMNQAKARGADGQPVEGGLFSEAEQAIVMNGLKSRCDALDGAEDGLIFNVKGCDFDPMQVACPAGVSGDNCISAEKAEVLKIAMAGPVDSRGVQVYPRFVYDMGIDDNNGFLPGLLVAGGAPPVGPSGGAIMEQDVDAEFIENTATDQALGDSMSYRVSTFVNEGGKHIFYHGVADPWFSAMDTVEYYENMAAVNGGLESVNDWSRLFLAPGMGHCRGGVSTLDNFDMLSPLVEWVESDDAPEQVVATGMSMPGVSRPMCPWPSYPHYEGSGDPDSASNYSCKAPE